ncbi:FtsE family protein, partial [Microbacterium sp. HJ5]
QRVAIARALVNRPQVLLADEPTGNLDPATSVDIMQLLARINAGGTTVVMATHEAGFVDQMQRRVIELAHGELIRDERHGGYGDTSSLPSLAPEQERGAAAVAALTAVLEVQREAAAAAEAGLDPTLASLDEEVTDAASPAAPEPSEDPEPAIAAAPAALPVEDPTPVRPAGGETAAAGKTDADANPYGVAPAAPRTQPIPVADIPEVDLAELGVADRLGLGETDPDEEVGPTS